MLKAFLKTTVFVVLFFIPQLVFGSVVINEVLYDPEGTDTGKEYIRLYNNGDSDVDLTNWDLDPSSAAYFTFPSFILSAKSFVTVYIGTSGVNSSSDLYDNGSTNMSNTAGPIALFNSTTHSKDNLVDYIEYGASGQTNESKAVDAGTWIAGEFIPDAPEGKAIKLKIDGVDNNSVNDWIEAIPTIGATITEETTQTTQEKPSTSNINNPPVADAGNDVIAFIGQEIKFDGTESIDPENDELHCEWNMGDGKLIEKPTFSYKYLYPGTYVVVLMVFDGRSYSTDAITVKIQSIQITINEFMPNPSGKDEEEEWVEIFSDSDSITDISGWQLDDEDGGSKPFVFPENTLIAPKSYLVFPRQSTGIALNNDKDSVRLLAPEGIIFQEISYEKPPQGKSSAKTGEGFVWASPSPGTINLLITTGPEEKEIVYQGNLNKEITKEASQNQIIAYASEQKIESGYKELSISEKSEKENEIENQLATTKELISRHAPNNLIYFFVIVVLLGLITGLLLTRFRRHKSKTL